MSLQIIVILKYIFAIYAIVSIGVATYIIAGKGKAISSMAKESIDAAIGKSNSSYFNKHHLEAMLSKYGICATFHDYNLQPSTYIWLKCLISFGIFILFSAAILTWWAPIIGIALAVITFFAIDEIFKMSNKSDNDDMNADIIEIYNLLKIHSAMGIHISDSLIECQRNVSNRRLKEALAELNNNVLSSKITVEEAADQFNARFSNEHIDNLSVIIKQSLKTGRSSAVLSNIAKQIEIMNDVRAEAAKEKANRKMAILQVLIFSLISALALYIVGIDAIKSAKLL